MQTSPAKHSRDASRFTLRDWALDAAARLRRAGADAPRLIAEALLQTALGVDRAGLYARWLDPVPEETQGTLLEMLEHALRREPLAYILEEKEFWGLSLRVSRNVLVPRPETELLVEWALRLFPQGRSGAPLTVIDAGTGSGCITVALAREWPRARFVAIDRSCEALQVARENARRWGVEPRVSFVCGDWLTACAPRRASLVVANPPYLTTAEVASAPPEVRCEPRVALDGGESGLQAIFKLIEQVPLCLAGGGWFLMEIGSTQERAVLERARQAGAREAGVERDLAGLPRLLRARW